MSDRHRILVGDARDTLAGEPEGSAHLCVTSPPYWALRKYAGLDASVWGGAKDCPHEWGDEQPRAGNAMRQGESANSTFAGRDDKKAINEAANASTGGQWCRLCGAWRGCWGNEGRSDCGGEWLELRPDLTEVQRQYVAQRLLALGISL